MNETAERVNYASSGVGSIRRILIIRGGALGDAILAMPAVSAVRKTYPSASISVLGNQKVWEMVSRHGVAAIEGRATDAVPGREDCGAGPAPVMEGRATGPPAELEVRAAAVLVDEVFDLDSSLFSSLYSPNPASELRRWLADFDLAVSWSSFDFRPALEAAGVPLVIADSPYPPPGIHAAHWLLHTVSAPLSTDLDIANFRLDALSPSSQRSVGKKGLGHYVMIHPGAGASWKRWPPNRFAALVDALSDAGKQVALVEGPADTEAVAEVTNHAHSRVPVIDEADLGRLAAVLTQADLFIGNDSGVTHLAAVLGVPTIALFGPTDPVSWRPLGDSVVLRRCNAVPEKQGQVRVCEDPNCMGNLNVDDVLEELKRTGFVGNM